MKTTKLYFPLLALALLSIAVLVSACSKDEKVPEMRFGGPYQVWEDDAAGSVLIYAVLTSPAEKKVTVEYSTSDSTAVAGSDYTAATGGTITFNPGETSKSFTVNILENSNVKQDVAFTVKFSNPVNATLKYKSVPVVIKNSDFGNLVWSDEFSGSQLNTAVWTCELGAGGWGNNELETYTDKTENVSTAGGFLTITALNPSPGTYTSARIITRGKKEFTYGKVEIRAQLPETKGIWPALWTLGSNITTVSWPKCSEIDIMELLGHEPNKVYQTIHWDNSGYTKRGTSYTLPSGKFSDSFHTFAMSWTPNNIIWFVDGEVVGTQERSQLTGFPFDLPHFFIFNVAVGGNWPGSPDGTTVFPQKMIVDYIRLYQ